MRIFVVNEAYDKERLSAELFGEHQVAPEECETLSEALSESRFLTEDKISIIILNAAEKNQEKGSNAVLKIQTFGNFEVFFEDKPIAFSRAKSKELLAYLIDRRGAAVTTAEACAVLWEDKEYNFSLQRQFQTVVSDLLKSLKKYKADHFIHRKRNCLAVDVSALECDFYRLLAGDESAGAQYNGEYMTNYSWAEMTAGFLLHKSRQGEVQERKTEK